jgi:hypothetical protein
MSGISLNTNGYQLVIMNLISKLWKTLKSSLKRKTGKSLQWILSRQMGLSEWKRRSRTWEQSLIRLIVSYSGKLQKPSSYKIIFTPTRAKTMSALQAFLSSSLRIREIKIVLKNQFILILNHFTALK